MQEVGTRDGLQVEAQFVPTEDKIALVNALSHAGLAKIEVTSFVSPKAIPQLRDAEIVLREIERVPGVGLQRAGAQRARRRARDRVEGRRAEPRDVGEREPQPGQPAHDARAVVRGAGARWRPARRAAGGGQRLAVVWLRLPDGRRRAGGHACSTGARATSKSWARTASRCATPPAWPTRRRWRALTRAFRERWPRRELTLHFHNTRGMGLANVLAGIDAGADRFDASLRRHRRLPLCARRDRQRVHRGDRARAAS